MLYPDKQTIDLRGMPYIYHRKPSMMQGETLYPLSRLQEKYPAVFSEEMKKYTNREVLLQQKIPHLECFWSDVVFTVPLDPSHVFRAMKAAGVDPDPARLWYKIPISEVKEHSMAWYSYPNRSKDDFQLGDDEVTLLKAEEYQELHSVPQDTISYYKEAAQKGEQPFLFHLIPHVLIKSAIDISSAEIIRWAEG